MPYLLFDLESVSKGRYLDEIGSWRGSVYLGMRGIENGQWLNHIAVTVARKEMELEESSCAVPPLMIPPYHPMSIDTWTNKD